MAGMVEFSKVSMNDDKTEAIYRTEDGNYYLISTPEGKTFDDYTDGVADVGHDYYDPNEELIVEDLFNEENENSEEYTPEDPEIDETDPDETDTDEDTPEEDETDPDNPNSTGDEGSENPKDSAGTNQELEAARQKYEEALENYEEALENYEDALDDAEGLASDIEGLQDDIESLASDIEHLEEDAAELEEDYSDLSDKSEVVANSIDKMANANNTIENTQSKLDNLQSEFFGTNFDPVFTDTDPSTQVQDPVHRPVTGAEPVNLFSGAFYAMHTDISIGGLGPNLEITRYYNNQMYHKGVFGYKWSSVLDVHLKVLSDGPLYYWRANGSGNFFLPDDNGQYSIPMGYYEKITKTSQTITIEDRFGVVHHFTSAGKLTKIADRFGNELVFTRNSDGRITQIRDESGKTLNIVYNTDGYVERISDAEGREWYYAYEHDELIYVTYPVTDTNPSGRKMHYTYASGNDPRTEHNLEEIQNHNGETIVYNIYGPSDESFNRVTRQSYTGDVYTFNYELINDTLEDDPENRQVVFRRSSMVNGRGHTREYDFNIWGNPLRERIFTHAIRPGDPSQWTTSYEYDASGNESKIVLHTGAAISMVYDEESDDPLKLGNMLSLKRTSADGIENFTTHYEYGSYNQVEAIILSNGSRLQKTLDAKGLPISIEYPEVEAADAGTQIAFESFTYNNRGQNTFFTDAEGDITEFDFHDTGNKRGLLKRIKVNGKVTEEHEYDTLWRRTKITNADDIAITVEYDNENRIVTETVNEALGIKSRYEYNDEGYLKKTYIRNVDENGVVAIPEWIEENFEYDRRGRMIKNSRQIDAALFAEKMYEYDSEDNLTKITDPEGRVVAYQYDERNFLYKEIFQPGGPAESSTTYTYDGLGNNTITKDPLNRAYSNIYDGFGRLEKTTDPLNNYKLFTYDSNDNFRTEELYNSNGLLFSKQTNHWDIANRLIQTDAHIILNNVETGKLKSEFYFDKKNRLIKTIDVGNQEQLIEYNDLSAITKQTDSLGNETQIEYTQGGLPKLVKYNYPDIVNGTNAVFVRNIEYDEVGRIKQGTDALGNGCQLKWNSRNLLSTVVTPNGVTQTNSFDLADRMIKESLPWLNASGNSLGTIELINEYDKSGLLIAHTDSRGYRSQFRYDERTNFITLELPNGTQLYNNEYDEADNLVKQTDPNGTITEYTFDRLDRITRVDISSSANTEGFSFETYGYNCLNQLTSFTNDHHTVTKVYDSLHRLVEEAQNREKFEYQYGGNGLLESLKYPGGLRLNYTWDNACRLASISLTEQGSHFAGNLPVGSNIVSFNFIGKLLTQISYANGTVKHIIYDASGRAIQSILEDANGIVLEKSTTLHDADGNLVHLHREGIEIKSMYFDSVGQLEKVVQTETLTPSPDISKWKPSSTSTHPDADEDQNALNDLAEVNAVPETAALRLDEYTYDEAGNRSAFNRISNTENFSKSFTVNSINQYQNIQGVLPEYDSNGNLIFDGTFRYTYDARNRLYTVKKEGESDILYQFTYDNLNRVLALYVRGELVKQFFAGYDKVEDIRNGVYQNSVPGLGKDQEIMLNTEGSTYFRNMNEVRNLHSITDSTGNIAAYIVQDEFGNLLKVLDEAKNEISLPISAQNLFQGRPSYDETTLVNFRSRTYSSEFGRFIQQDGVGYASDSNLYRFVKNNPLTYIDPTGNYIESVWDGLSFGVGIASFSYNAYNGNYGSAAFDALGVVVDGAALALPFVPGGAGMAIKAFRAGDAALTAGTAAYRMERGTRLAQAAIHGVDAAQGLVAANQQFSEGNYAMGALNLVMAGVGARGMGSKWYNAPRPTPRTPISETEAKRGFTGMQDKLHFWADGPWRPFGNNLSLILNPRTAYSVGNLFSDNRTFKRVSDQYWEASGRANGNSLQHAWALNSGIMPQWFRNSGLNLVEVPKRINSWMGDNFARNAMFKGQLLTSVGIGATAGGWGTKALGDLLFGGPTPTDLATNPVNGPNTGCN